MDLDGVFFKLCLQGVNLRRFRVWSSTGEDGKACCSPKRMLSADVSPASSPLGLVLTLLSLAEVDARNSVILVLLGSCKESVPRLIFSSVFHFPQQKCQ